MAIAQPVIQATQAPAGGAYATVNGLRICYEVYEAERDYRERPPMVLLHGALSTIHTDFEGVLRKLSGSRRIIAVEQQAHGHTSDSCPALHT